MKAGSLQETRLCAEIMHGLAVTELPLHVGICAREGITEDDLYNTKKSRKTSPIRVMYSIAGRQAISSTC